MTPANCPYCAHTPRTWSRKRLNEKTLSETDLEVYVGHLGDALIVKHFDIEGDTYDTVDTVPINFCPMCGRKLNANE